MTTTKKKAPAKSTKAKEKAEEVELEETEAVDEGSDTKKTKAGKTDEVTFGAKDLAELANKKFGTKHDARAIRTQLRRMAREDNPRINREVKQGNRERYSWSGPDDPEVIAVLEAIGKGEIDVAKKEALDALKEKGAAKKKAKQEAKAAKEKKKGKAKGGDAPSDDDEAIDLEDD